MSIRQRGDRWQADVRSPDGVRLRPTFTTQAAALRWEAEAKIAIAEGRSIPNHATHEGASPTTEPTLETVVKQLLETAPPVGWKGRRSEMWMARNADAAVKFFGRHTRPSEVTQQRLEDYIAALGGIGNANGTINRKLAALSKMLRYAKRKGWLKVMPEIDRQEESEGRLRWLTWEEQDRLVGALRVEGQHLAADLTEFLADSGLRVGEALTLTLADVDGRLIHIDPSRAKSGRYRGVPQTDRVRALIAKRRAELNGKEPTERLWPLSASTYRTIFERARSRAKLGDDVVRHTLRHTCASRLVQAGIDIRRVKEWLGHSSITVTMRYAHLAPEHLYEAAAALNRGSTGPELKVVDGDKSRA